MYLVSNDVTGGQSKNYKFETMQEAFTFAEKKAKRDKRNILIFAEKKSNNWKGYEPIYRIYYYMGGISRQKI